MPRNGAGVYTAPANSFNPAVSGATIESSAWNLTLPDLAAALTQSVSNDGQTPMVGALQMGANKIIGLANGTVATDAATVGQIATVASGTFAVLSGNNIYTGNQTVNGSTSLSGTLNVFGAVIFTSTAALNTLAVASTASVTTIGTGSLTVTGRATLATASVGSGVVVGAASGGNLGRGFINVASGFAINGTSISSTGKLVSVVSGTYTTNTDLSTVMTADDTAPVVTDGTQIISISVTTTSATQQVWLSFNGLAGGSTSVQMTGAIFRASTLIVAGGLGSGAPYGGLYDGPATIDAVDTPGSAATFTYTVRVGPNTSVMRMNGTVISRLYGGTAKTILRAQVIEP